MSTVSVNRFDGGMVPDIRDESIGASKTIKHFDILTRPNSLTPFHSQITGDSSSATQQMTDFIYYNSIVYGVGTDSGTSLTTVHTKSDFTSATWGSTAKNASSSGTMIQGVFFEYHDFMYGANSGGTIWKYDPAGGVNWNDSITSLASSATCNGIVHSKDDCAYIGAANIVARNNNGSWTNAALTLPARYIITCLAEYGNYLAVACKPKYVGKSVVYLWDRDSSLNTVTEVIDFGFGNLQIIEQIEGELIGISLRQDVPVGFGSTKLVFRRYSGTSSIVFKELLATTSVGLQLLYGQKFNANRLYFLAGITIDGVLHNGVWALGKNTSGRWIVWFDKLPNNDTAIAASSLTGFFMVGDFTFISYSDGGYKLTQTSTNSTAYAGSSLIETVINPQMPLLDRTKNKQVDIIAVSYDPIPSGGQVVCKYKVDGSSYKTIFTETTQGKVTTEKTVRSVLGREFQFRIESTGGVMISEIKYSYSIVKTLI